jgi:hypothetical protein
VCKVKVSFDYRQVLILPLLWIDVLKVCHPLATSSQSHLNHTDNKMAFSKQLVLKLVAVVLLMRSCAVIAKGGPRGRVSANLTRRKLQLVEVPVAIQVQGTPGTLTNEHLRILENLFMETYNTEQICHARVENVIFETPGGYAGTGLALRTFTLNGFVTVSDEVLFPTMTVRTVTSTCGKGKSKSSEDVKACAWTRDTFVTTFDSAIQTVVNSVMPDFSVKNIIYMTELTSVDCNEQGEFTSNVLVTFTGDASVATPAQLDQLAYSFLETYNKANKANSQTCDPLFREVSSVSLIAGQRRLEKTNGHAGRRKLASLFTYKYQVNSTCRGCPDNTRLFGDGIGRRQLSPTNRNLEFHDCVCSVDATELRAATTDEFAVSYGVSIVVLQEEAVVEEELVESVVGVEERDCNDDEAFEMDVYIKFEGACTASDEQRTTLEQEFRNSYLNVAKNFCDPYLRNIVEIDALQSLVGTTLCQYRFLVKGFCHGGCNGNPTLFGVGESCFCTVDSIENRSPTVEEFRLAYNGALPNLNIVEVGKW